MVKVHIETDADGYIASWGTDHAASGAVDVAEAELDKIVLGASKLVEGKVIVDADKLAAIRATVDVAAPTVEQQMINALGLQVAQLQAKLAEGGGANA